LARTEDPVGPRLSAVLRAARGRVQNRITEPQQLLRRIDDFEADHAAELAGRADFRAQDPRAGREPGS
ncbi:MAG TPA: hypothetical protein VJ010_02855, partial [Actinomycetota bacterium]|nr:hypothetical protein [Actinomycetota bacterium]